MKLKYLFLTLSAIAFAIGAAMPATAQQAKVYTLLPGGTTFIQGGLITNTWVTAAGGTTNLVGLPGSPTNLFMPVGEFDNVGLTIAANGTTASTNGNFGFSVYRSYDNGVTYESVPYWTYQTNAPFNTAASWVVATNLPVQGASTLAFTMWNSCPNATGWYSNVLVEVNLKSPKYGSKTATR